MRKAIAAATLAIVLAVAGCCPLKGICPCANRNPHIGRVRHVVLFKFKDTATPEQIDALVEDFRALKAKIPAIRDYEWGTDISVEKRSEGYTHCFLVTFDDAEARDAYLPHPAHKALVKKLQPILDKVLVLDYIAQR